MRKYQSWADQAQKVILEVHLKLPEKCSLRDRISAVDAAYPFGPRIHHPYKMWLQERFRYLSKYGYVKKGQKLIQTPLEAAIQERNSEGDSYD